MRICQQRNRRYLPLVDLAEREQLQRLLREVTPFDTDINAFSLARDYFVRLLEPHVPQDEAARLVVPLIFEAAMTPDPTPGPLTRKWKQPTFPLRAARHLMGLVEYPRGLDTPIEDTCWPGVKSEGVTRGQLQGALDRGDPRQFKNSRFLVAALAGRYGTGRSVFTQRKGRIRDVAEAVGRTASDVASGPDVLPLLQERAAWIRAQANAIVPSSSGKPGPSGGGLSPAGRGGRRRAFRWALGVAAFVGAALAAVYISLAMSQSVAPDGDPSSSAPTGNVVPGFPGWCEDPSESLFGGGDLDSDSITVWLSQDGACPERALSATDADEPVEVWIWYFNRSGVQASDVRVAGFVPSAAYLVEPITYSLEGTERDVTDDFLNGGVLLGTFAPQEGAQLHFSVHLTPADGCGPLTLAFGAQQVGESSSVAVSSAILDRGPCD